MTAGTADNGSGARGVRASDRVDAERLQKIQELLLRALEITEDERAGLLSKACADDEALRLEVESLLRAHSTSGPVDRLADTLGARLLAEFVEGGGLEGETVGRYDICERLGRGGMSVVYRARDPELEREVALKFLPALLSSDATSRERFLVEARVAAGLDHPNICTIFEIGEAEDGRLFIAMPLYEGETLEARLESGPLSEEEVLLLALQAARGLARAHDCGVVHRDIKPGNLMITLDGTLKILDFGIAQLEGTVSPAGHTPGTALYMSPEQVAGGEVDARTDLWSLGVVMYEMLAGRRPFEGRTSEEVRQAIVEGEIRPLTDVRPAVSSEIATLVGVLLQKEPSRRIASAAELEKAVRRLWRGRGEGVDKRRRRGLAAVAGLLGAALLSFVGVWFWRDGLANRRGGTPIAPRWTQVTFSGNVVIASISPNGREVAYVTGQPSDHPGLFLQNLSGGEPMELATFSGTDSVLSPTLAWSPDGSSLLHHDRIIPRVGGSPRTVGIGKFASWSPDGETIVSWRYGDQMYLTHTLTGETRGVRLLEAPASLVGGDWSPTADRIAFVTTNGGSFSLRITTPDGRRQELLVQDTLRIRSPRWSPDARAIYYFGTDELRAIRISEEGTAAGDPEVLLSGLQLGPAVIPSFTISRDGRRLAYAKNVMHSNLWRVSLDSGAVAGTTHKEPLTTGTSLKWGPAVSPNGRLVAYVEGIIGSPPNDIFVIPIDGGPPTQVTFTGGVVTYPSWSADSRSIAFGANVGGRRQVWTVRIGQPSRLLEDTQLSGNWGGPLTWAPGERIAYERQGSNNVFLVDPDTGIEEPLLAKVTDGWIGHPRSSPDGRHVAVLGNFGRRGGVWAISLANRTPTLIGERRLPVRWSEDGLGVYASVAGDTILTLLPLSGGGPIAVTKLPRECRPQLTVVPGEQELICIDVQQSNDVWMVENFDPRAR